MLEAEIQQRKLQAKLHELNVRAILLSPSGEGGMGFGPYGTFQVNHELEESDKRISILKEDLENLREQLRKSGRPRSWENSRAALRASSKPRESDGAGLRDQQYWQEHISLIDSYYDSLIAPLEAELSGDGEPGNTYTSTLDSSSKILSKGVKRRKQPWPSKLFRPELYQVGSDEAVLNAGLTRRFQPTRRKRGWLNRESLGLWDLACRAKF